VFASRTLDCTPGGRDQAAESTFVAWSKLTLCRIGPAAELVAGLTAKAAAATRAMHTTLFNDGFFIDLGELSRSELEALAERTRRKTFKLTRRTS
jgi:hypothetical protein